MCIFCDIAQGKIPSSTIYEDDKVIAFLDLSQVTKGHTLVVPKQHESCIHAGPAYHAKNKCSRHEHPQQCQ